MVVDTSPTASFRKSHGLSELVVDLDCSDNDYNIRPAVDAVVERYSALRLANPTKPIIVLLSEVHSMPAHVALQAAIIDEVARCFPEERMVYAREASYKSAAAIFNNLYPSSYVSAEALDEDSPNGRRALEIRYSDLDGSGKSDHARKMVYAVLHKNPAIAFASTDAPLTREGKVNIEDQKMKALLGQEVSNKPDAWSAEGMKMRNLHIAHEDLQLCAKGYMTVYQQLGRAHPLGAKANAELEREECNFSDSLYAHLDKGEAIILPVFITDSQDMTDVPLTAAERNAVQNLVTINGLCEMEFDKHGFEATGKNIRAQDLLRWIIEDSELDSSLQYPEEQQVLARQSLDRYAQAKLRPPS